jgi:hypothetical protein
LVPTVFKIAWFAHPRYEIVTRQYFILLESPATCGRGLKPHVSGGAVISPDVARHVRAWIETGMS